MAVAPFFDRVWGAIGGHLAVSRETLSSVLQEVTVAVHCARRISQNDKWIAELCVNLAARLYPRLRISAPDDLGDELYKLARSINPDIELCDSGNLVRICVGPTEAPAGIYPSARGWVARLGHVTSAPSGRANPYAAGVAAALACAEVFRRIFLKAPPEPDVALSLLDYHHVAGEEVSLPKRDVGQVLVVGVGAVGNAALWAISRDEKITGRLVIVDPEEVALSNLQRYVLAGFSDIGTQKVKLAQRHFANGRWAVEPHAISLDELAPAEYERIPTTMVSVDNVAGRRAAQALLPRLVVNGWTGEDALGASWHVFSSDVACLACLYHPHGKGMSQVEQAARALGLEHDRVALLWATRQPLNDVDLQGAALALGVNESDLKPWRGKPIGELYTDVVCGAAPLELNGIDKMEMVPLAHQSALAGLMMGAELIKRTNLPLARLAQPEPLISWDNVLRGVPEIWCKPRAKEQGCICGDDDYQSAYRNKWEGPQNRHKRR